MARDASTPLSRRERQIMDIVYATGHATVAQVRAAMPDAPSYSAVRAMMRILEDKGHLTHRRDGARYVYRPKRSRRNAGQSAMRRVLSTFYDGQVDRAVAALLDVADLNLPEDEKQRLLSLIDKARSEGR
jgi:predicted transcriptional regulator